MHSQSLLDLAFCLFADLPVTVSLTIRARTPCPALPCPVLASVHPGLWDAFRHIYVEEGVRGLFRGANAAMARVAVGSAVQLTSCTYRAVLCVSV